MEIADPHASVWLHVKPTGLCGIGQVPFYFIDVTDRHAGVPLHVKPTGLDGIGQILF